MICLKKTLKKAIYLKFKAIRRLAQERVLLEKQKGYPLEIKDDYKNGARKRIKKTGIYKHSPVNVRRN